MKVTRRRLTASDSVRAQILRANGVSFDRLEKMFNVSYETIRRAVDPEYGEERNQISRERRSVDRVTTRDRAVASPELIADRDLRSELPRTLTSLLCGDPPPGFSALDKKNVGV